MSPRASSVCLAVLLILAGCTGSFSLMDETTTDTTTTETTQTSDATTTATTVTASTTTLHARTTLSPEDLTAADRDLLGRAIENRPVTVWRLNRTGELTPDTDGWHVRYRGMRYELSWERQGLRGKYAVESVTSVNASAVESSRGVVAYENLTADAREMFEAVQSGDETDEYGPGAFPDQFREYGYVAYDGKYYDLEVSVGDYVVYRFSVEAVES